MMVAADLIAVLVKLILILRLEGLQNLAADGGMGFHHLKLFRRQLSGL